MTVNINYQLNMICLPVASADLAFSRWGKQRISHHMLRLFNIAKCPSVISLLNFSLPRKTGCDYIVSFNLGTSAYWHNRYLYQNHYNSS